MVINKGREYDSMSEDKIEAIGEVEYLKKEEDKDTSPL
jgi:hypothetical protein